MSNNDQVEQFFDQIAAAHDKAKSLGDSFFTRVLLLTLLDALAHCAHPNLKGNRQRFAALIDEYAHWPLSSSYSLRQLDLLLSGVSNAAAYPGFQQLLAEVGDRMKKWPQEGSLVDPHEVDPTTSDLKPLLTAETARLIDRVRYPNLTWQLRNFVIHELRNPGKGLDFDLKRPLPYYHTITHVDGITRTWELYFPNELLSELISNASANLKARLLRDDIDPWQAFPYSPRWFTLPNTGE